MLPLHDWQFWVASLIALAAAVQVVRGVVPQSRRRAAGKRVKLTISAKPPVR